MRGISAHNVKLLMSNYEGGKQRDLAPIVRKKSSIYQSRSYISIRVYSYMNYVKKKLLFFIFFVFQ